MTLAAAPASAQRPGLTSTEDPQGTPLDAPPLLFSNDGLLRADLYVQFARAMVSGASTSYGTPLDTIWTRAYGQTPITPGFVPFLDIPGPTFVYHPGDLLEIKLHNQLNRALEPQLESYETNVPPNSQDDIEEVIPHEINIPHNADNTNLHVHGMHVDPKQDDVTLLILPEDDNPSYYTPSLQRSIPDHNRWWEWTYRYKLPLDHMPGTHWYHDHKHGATSTHVENGMAGTLLLRPRNDDRAIVPGLWNDDPALSHDRVLMLQEIANYGVQQGRGISVSSQSSSNDTLTVDWPDITVNGQHQPELALRPGQTERWRVIAAGSNHRIASYLWVGKLTPPATISDTMRAELAAITDYATAHPYLVIGGSTAFTDTFPVTVEPFDGTVEVVALDGITVSEAIEVRPDRPILVGPGNRADFIVQPAADASGPYYFVKNYNAPPPQYVLAAHPDYGDLFQGEAGYWRYLALTTMAGGSAVTTSMMDGGTDLLAPFQNLNADPYALGTNFKGFKVPWPYAVDVDGRPLSDSTSALALAPVLRGREAAHNGADVAIVAGDDFAFPGLGWSPVSGSGLADAQALMTVRVSGRPVTGGPQPPTDRRLDRLSPTGDPARTLLWQIGPDGERQRGIPGYASPIADADVANRQVVVFDQSGVDFLYKGPNTNNTTIHQFSLNGRQFDLDDFVGNPHADHKISAPIPPVVPTVYANDYVIGDYIYNANGRYTNQVQIGGRPEAYFTNPGTYLPVVDTGGGVYNYDYGAATGPPTYAQVTGLDVPRQPQATTAEEWVLVNNTGAFHPFHIHINPLFLTEVGQLSYDGTEWAMERLDEDDPLGYALNNWWDVVMIPPRGYVKFRTWFNIPDQGPRNPTIPNRAVEVTENANVFGAWVYHCHILRHEDRGMMMVVNVRPKPGDTDPPNAPDRPRVVPNR